MTQFIIWSMISMLTGVFIGYAWATYMDTQLINRLRDECKFWQEQRHAWKVEALSRANVKYDD